MRDLFNWFGIVLTPSLLTFAWLTFARWWPLCKQGVWSAIKTRTTPPSDALIAFGISLCALASVFDNVYWEATWALDIMHVDFAEDLINWGVFHNLPFRTIFPLVGYWAHVKAGEIKMLETGHHPMGSEKIWKTTLLAGLALGVLILIVRGLSG